MTTGTITFNIDNPDMGLTGDGQIDISQVFKSLFTEPDIKNQVSNKIAEVIKGINKTEIITDWKNKLKDAFVIDEANINLKKIVEDKVKDVLKTTQTSDTSNKSETKGTATTAKPDLVSKTIISSFKNFDIKITEFLKKVEKTSKQPDSNASDSVFEQKNEVVVSNFTDEALKKLEKITGGKTKDVEPVKDKGLPDSWLKNLAMAAVGILGGSIALGISAIFDNGPFKGLKKLIANLGIRFSQKLFLTVTELVTEKIGAMSGILTKAMSEIAENTMKVMSKMFPEMAKAVTAIGGSVGGNILKTAALKVGKLLKPLLGKLYLIGSMISFYNAKSRFEKDDIIGGLLDITSGLANLIPGPIGMILSTGIDILSAVRDAKFSGAEWEAKGGGGKGTAIFKVIGAVAIKFGSKFLKPILKKLPLIGSILNFVDAYQLFSTGNILKGSIALISGIAGFIPGIGTAISIGLDVLNAFISPNTEEPKKTEAKGSGFSLSKIWKGMIELIKKHPLVKMFTGIGKAFGLFSSGEWKNGFKALGNILPNMLGLGDIFETKEEITTDKQGNPIDIKALRKAREDAQKNAQVANATPTATPAVQEHVQTKAVEVANPATAPAPAQAATATVLTPQNTPTGMVKDEESGEMYSATPDKEEQPKSIFYNKTGKPIKIQQSKQLDEQVKKASPVKALEQQTEDPKQTQLKQLTQDYLAKKAKINEEFDKTYPDLSPAEQVKKLEQHSKLKQMERDAYEKQYADLKNNAVQVQDAIIDFGKFKVKPDKQDKMTPTETGGILAKSGGVLEKQFKELIHEVKILKNVLSEVVINMNKEVNKNLTILCNTSDKQLQTLPLLAPKPEVTVNKAPSGNSRDGIFEYRKRVYELGRI